MNDGRDHFGGLGTDENARCGRVSRTYGFVLGLGLVDQASHGGSLGRATEL